MTRDNANKERYSLQRGREPRNLNADAGVEVYLQWRDCTTLPILGIVFSRDRAMQLDATLASLFLHCRDAKELQLSVIYETGSHSHSRQYARLAKQYGSVRFIEQRDFRQDVLRLLFPQYVEKRGFRRLFLGLHARFGKHDDVRMYGCPARCVLFLVDDNIFVRDFSVVDIQGLLQAHARSLGFSLRLGTNTRYCYPLDKPQIVPRFTRVGNGVIIFDWTSARESGYDFSYPLEVSSSVYRVGDLLPLLIPLRFRNPNTLEGMMAANSLRFGISKPFLLCYEQSRTFCAPLNRVQTIAENRASVAPEYSAKHLSEMFDDGYRINVNAYSGFVPNACHQEVELQFERRATDS